MRCSQCPFTERSMNISRTVAIILTAVTAILVGIPALGITCFGIFMAISARNPYLTENSHSSTETILAAGIMIAVFGLGVLLLVVGVGVFSIRFSRPDQAAGVAGNDLPSPP